jgi:hypothetical protein
MRGKKIRVKNSKTEQAYNIRDKWTLIKKRMGSFKNSLFLAKNHILIKTIFSHIPSQLIYYHLTKKIINLLPSFILTSRLPVRCTGSVDRHLYANHGCYQLWLLSIMLN